MSDINEKELWQACEPMREDGMAISRYLEQLSSLLFLKACNESGKISLHKLDDEDDLYLPEKYHWDNILQSNNSLEMYEEAVKELQNDGELARKAFDNFTPQFNRESTFNETMQQIDSLDSWDDFGGEDSTMLGDAYEYLLEKYADKAEGAGEYFTPRPLIKAMVEIIDPDVGESIVDPASGTNGFLIESYLNMKEKTNNFENVKDPNVENSFTSRELRTETFRLGLMNYLLHDIDPASVNAMRGNSILEEKSDTSEYDVVLANPPFGSDIDTQYSDQCDSSIEMNFLMMMMDMLNDNGRAAIIVPEGILFDSSKVNARDELIKYFDLDCILTLPENTFHPYAGVDANVLFFSRDGDGTDEFWYYDARSEYDGIKESNPLEYDKHLSEFVDNWNTREECEKYFKVESDEIDEDNYELHLKKYKEFKYDGHRPPKEIAQDIRDELNTIETELDQMVGDDDE